MPPSKAKQMKKELVGWKPTANHKKCRMKGQNVNYTEGEINVAGEKWGISSFPCIIEEGTIEGAGKQGCPEVIVNMSPQKMKFQRNRENRRSSRD